MNLIDLQTNEFYNQICNIISEKFVIRDDLQIFITNNTYTKSTCDRQILVTYEEEEVLNSLEIDLEDYQSSISENKIQVLNNDTTIDVIWSTFKDGKEAVFLTFYKVVE